MKIINKWIETQSGLEAIAEYEDSDNFSELPYEECSQVACFAFNKKGELLVVYKEKTNTWGVVAGSINKPETFEECAIRELKEESNTRPIKIEPIWFPKSLLGKQAR